MLMGASDTTDVLKKQTHQYKTEDAEHQMRHLKKMEDKVWPNSKR